MNLAESTKFVLKTKSRRIVASFWKNDLLVILKGLMSEIPQAFQHKGQHQDSLKRYGLKNLLSEFKDSGSEAISIFKVIPDRIIKGFKFFRDDFLSELESQPDPKQKTIFCIKVIGALSRFALGALYGFKKSKGESNLLGIGKHRNYFTQFLMSALIFKISQILVLRVLEEIEQELSDPESLKHLLYFKKMLSDSTEPTEEMFGEAAVPGEKSFELVENLKHYIMTGERVTFS
jgi:hypothetical protein